MNIYEMKFEQDKEEKVPTYRQYLKANKGKKMAKAHHVNLIWLPIRFPSYCVETERFRLTVGRDSLMGKAISAAEDDIYDLEKSLNLLTEVSESGLTIFGFKLGTNKGFWEAIGDDPVLGLKFRTA